jgi:hypothetical protein
VGARGRAGRGAEPAVHRVRNGGLPGAERRRGAGRRGHTGPQARRAPQPWRRVRLLRPPRHAPLARHEVRPGRARDRLPRGAVALASAAAHARHRRRRALALQRGALRRAERGSLRGSHALRRRRRRGDRHRRLVPRRIRRARVPRGRALHRPRVWAAPLGAGVPARVRRTVAALALPSQPPGAGGAGPARDRADRRRLRRRARRPARRRRLPRSHHVRVLVPAAAPARGTAGGDPAHRLGAAPRSPRRHRASGADRLRVRLALRRRALGWRARDRPPRRAVWAARRHLPVV